MFASLFFAMTWYRERREEKAAEYLVSELGLHDIFTELCQKSCENSSSNIPSFSRRKIAHIISNSAGTVSILKNNPALLESAVQIIIIKLTERGTIKKVKTKGIDEIYTIN